ncbi:MAG: hypothetical protein PHT19_08930 [Methylococcus sp.]|nr:hypothetical protein [Methylococcus sp.]
MSAQPSGKINVEKQPALADFGGRDFAGTRFVPEGDRVQLQERGGLLEVEGLHRLDSVG